MPTASERALLLSHLGALRSDAIRDFLRDRVTGLGRTKEQSLGRAIQALEAGEIAWNDLITYLDQVEPYGKQHIFLYGADAAAVASWGDAAAAEAHVRGAGHGDLWQVRLPLAAPSNPKLASITYQPVDGGGIVNIHAVQRRSYRQRREDLDQQGFSGQSELEAIVYERVDVRSWIRLSLNTATNQAAVHVSQLKRQDDYEAVRVNFLDMISNLVPSAGFQPINLPKAIRNLHEKEEQGQPVASAQALLYEGAGVRSSLSSAQRGQSVINQTQDLTDAAKLLRTSGAGAGGNFYFLPAGSGPSQSPLAKPVHVSLVAQDHRINLRQPVQSGELEYVLSQIRYLSS